MMRQAYAISLLLLGCTQSTNNSDDNAVDLTDAEVKTTVAYLLEPRFAEADLARGELLSLACQACHTLDVGQADLLGPNLYGVFGRVAAGTAGFSYSSVLRSADFTWTPGALDAWLANPAEFLPGNDMAFAGYSSTADRRDLIAFLLHKTGGIAE